MPGQGSAPAGGVSVEAVPRPLAKRAGFHPMSYIFTRPHIAGYIFIAPWFIGFLIWTLGPFLISIGLSFTNWSLLGTTKYVGLANYRKMFFDDVRYRSALWNTVYYTIVSEPLKQVIALAIALLLNQKLRGIYIYRTIFYLPSVTSGVATAILWSQIFGYRLGIANALLNKVGIDSRPWLTGLNLAMPTLIFISLWNVGNIFIIYLAGLQGVPSHYYEAAEVDGAGVWHKFRHVTIPLITPSIFFNVVMGFIGSFRVFVQAYVITAGGPADRTLVYVLYLYYKAFQDLRLGYASAMAWVLFLIILSLTLVQLALSRKWVYYEGAAPGRGRI